jgi:hypothetical protein
MKCFGGDVFLRKEADKDSPSPSPRIFEFLDERGGTAYSRDWLEGRGKRTVSFNFHRTLTVDTDSEGLLWNTVPAQSTSAEERKQKGCSEVDTHRQGFTQEKAAFERDCVLPVTATANMEDGAGPGKPRVELFILLERLI